MAAQPALEAALRPGVTTWLGLLRWSWCNQGSMAQLWLSQHGSQWTLYSQLLLASHAADRRTKAATAAVFIFWVPHMKERAGVAPAASATRPVPAETT